MFDFSGYGFVDLSMIGIIIIGILIGIEHTFEIDHVVAVSTLVSQKKMLPPGESELHGELGIQSPQW